MPQVSEARRLACGAVPTTPGTVLTISTVNRAIVSSYSLTNSASASRTVDLWIVPAGNSASNSNKFLHVVLFANESQREGQLALVLEPGDQIVIDADGADVSYFISGAMITSV